METVQKIESLQDFASQIGASEASALANVAFPSRKDEYWKYTRTNKIAKGNWSFQAPTSIESYASLVAHYPNRMVFVNGYFQDSLSNLPSAEGLEIAENTVQASQSDVDVNPFLNVNQAIPQAGYSISVNKNTKVEDIVYIVNIYDGSDIIAQPQNKLTVATGSEFKLTEVHIHQGESASFTNILSQIEIGANTHVGIDVLQYGHPASSHLQHTEVYMPSDAVFTQNVFSLSGGWIRNNSNVKIDGSNSTANLNGFYIPSGKDHVDNHTIIDHLKPHCDSNELFRGVLLDNSTGVFNGKVFVRPDAQKTNAFQSNGNIIMSDTASMNSKPELEIYADDVKCSHGSTTGQFDEEAVFYLMARGISRSTARKMLVEAFAEDVLAELVNEDLSEVIKEEIHRKLSK